ncbi:MAG TPA: DNA ligase D [Ignavibacteria bacterium]|nr:DNA ligase D [Ignavibacteria bacterium]
MSLSLYKKKRDFKKTPEPLKSSSGKKGKLRFVVQKHDASHLHYDFRLEMEGVLKSWAVPKGPSMDPSDKRLAVMVEDHPLDYGNFYGIIPEGNYGAGVVEIWDKGTFRPMENPGKEKDEKLLLAMLNKGDLKIILNGHYLKGAFALVRMKDEKEKNWLLIKKKDRYAEDNFDIKNLIPLKIYKKGSDEKQNKKKTKNTEESDSDILEKEWEILKKPMLAKLTDKAFDDPEWIYEIKYDGYRAVTKIQDGRVEMLSRNGNNFNTTYPTIVKELERVKDEAVLDGEIVIENQNGIPDFQLLQNYSKTKKGVLKYFIFDILYLNGHKLTGLPLFNRRVLLESFFKKYKFKDIFLTKNIESKGSKYFETISKKGYEGIIAKEKNGLYYPGRRAESWLKIKAGLQQEAVIGGFTLPQNSRKHFGSLILGVYENDELKYIGNCGTGFTNASLKELFDKLNPLVVSETPFKKKPIIRGPKGKAVWVKPELVCDVKFSEWTDDGHIRHPVFNGLRNDKKAVSVINESKVNNMPEKKPGSSQKSSDESSKEQILKIDKKNVKVTNFNKIYWKDEKISKGDLINYYISVSKYIIPYLKNRPESLNRHPNGIDAPGFFQKDMEVSQLPVWVKTAKLYSTSNNKYIDYLICNDAATLIYMANLGCIEINPWNSVYSKPDYPDYMILDLDPGNIGFKEVVKTAIVIKDICDEIGVLSYCKTSGSTGLHIYLPLKGKYDYDQVKVFGQIFAEAVNSRLPDITSTERTVSKRKDKIYIDYLQNRKGQTIAAPYSVRPRPYATVSTPLLWKEVNESLSPADFTINNVKKRLDRKGDLWKGVLGPAIPMLKALKKLEKI